MTKAKDLKKVLKNILVDEIQFKNIFEKEGTLIVEYRLPFIEFWEEIECSNKDSITECLGKIIYQIKESFYRKKTDTEDVIKALDSNIKDYISKENI